MTYRVRDRINLISVILFTVFFLSQDRVVVVSTGVVEAAPSGGDPPVADDIKSIKVYKSSKCSPFNSKNAKLINKKLTTNKCKKRCLKKKGCLAFQYRKNKRKCFLLSYEPEEVVSANKNNFCGIASFVTESAQPSSAPSSTWLSGEQWISWGRVEYSLSNAQFTLQSERQSDLGVLITSHAYNDADVDFMIEYEQQTFEDDHNGYEGQPYIFLAPTGTYPKYLTQNDNAFDEFEQLLVGFMRSKIWTSSSSPMNHTWFKVGSSGQNSNESTNTRLTKLSLRIRRYNQEIYGYYRLYNTEEWIQIGSPLPLAENLKNVPLQFGVRVKKEYKPLYKFTMRAQKLAGGPPIQIPTEPPTSAPTEKKTWIEPGTDFKPPACPSNYDRSSLGKTYETRGIGGGGAMSGLSISPWNSLWFVGTDMGTLFRSTDRGKLWYPVSHDEQTFTSFLSKSGPVGFTSDPNILTFASCKKLSSHKCIAKRSSDAGLTWSPIDITGGSEVDNEGNPALDYIPKQWVGSLLQTSNIVFVSMHGGGGIYRSNDNGLNWNKVILPFDDTDTAAGLFLDQSVSPPSIYFATSRGVFMWEDGRENVAREIWSPSGETMIQSFTGGRSSESGRITLAIVDDNVEACKGQSEKDCGYVYTFTAEMDAPTAATTQIIFSKRTQRGFRVVASPTDASMFYVTGSRSWPKARGTSVWVGKWIEGQNDFSFSLKFLQSDVDNSYANWPASKLDYSAVGLDVGYWDAGYYTFNVNPTNSSQAGGSGNFFLHVTNNGGENWESPFTEHADSCHTQGIRGKGQRWRSTGLEMTSIRWLKFNPHNTSYGFASSADIRMLRTDDSGETWGISGGTGSGLIGINTIYDYSFAGPHTIFAVGGNFHDWPHEWYKNLRRGAGGVFISVDSGSSWRRLGSMASMNCNDDFLNVDCTLKDDMRRQILSLEYDDAASTLYVGTQSAGVARLKGLEPIISNGTFEELDALEWEWINSGLGSSVNRIIPELKLRNGKLFCLLSGDAPHFTNNKETGIYEWDDSISNWIHKKTTVVQPPNVGPTYDIWAYPTGFEIDNNGNMWLIDMETNGNYLASGIWKSIDGETWNRLQQFTFPYNIMSVGNRVYVSGAKAWGVGGMLHSDDGGSSWIKNTNLPLLNNGNSAVIDPRDPAKIYYTFFGGGMLHGPVP